MQTDPMQLTDDEAQRVLLELFELLPGAGKPDYDEMASLVDDLREDAPEEVAQPLGHLNDSAALRGALARGALASLAADPAVRPLVDSAIERAGRAHMMGLPELMAGVVVILAALPSQIQKDGKGGFTVEWNQLQNLAVLVKSAAEVVKVLPKSLLESLG